MARTELKAKLLYTGHWQGEEGSLTYSLFALSEDGRIYRYKPSEQLWYALGMEIHNPGDPSRELEEDSDYHGGFGSNY